MGIDLGCGVSIDLLRDNNLQQKKEGNRQGGECPIGPVGGKPRKRERRFAGKNGGATP